MGSAKSFHHFLTINIKPPWTGYRSTLAFLFILIFILPASLGAQAYRARSTPFTARVRASFTQWDQDHNGHITPDELNHLMNDPTIKGDDAAALATLRKYTRTKKGKEPFECTLDSLRYYEQVVAARRKPRIDFDRYYRAYCARIRQVPRQLYADGIPHRSSIQQNSGGDCFFLSVVGAMADRNPEELTRLIRENDDGSCSVRFPNGHIYKVLPPTDAEAALYTDDRADGTWLYVLMNAFGQERIAHNPRFSREEEPGEATDTAGSQSYTMSVLLGHRTRIVSVGPANPQGASKMRAALEKALSENLIVIAGTPSIAKIPGGRLPRGIPGSHAMTVLSYDRASDTVTIWNPWGNTFTPAAPLPWGGYPTRNGVFTIPVNEAVHYLRALTIEMR